MGWCPVLKLFCCPGKGDAVNWTQVNPSPIYKYLYLLDSLCKLIECKLQGDKPTNFQRITWNSDKTSEAEGRITFTISTKQKHYHDQI